MGLITRVNVVIWQGRGYQWSATKSGFNQRRGEYHPMDRLMSRIDPRWSSHKPRFFDALEGLRPGWQDDVDTIIVWHPRHAIWT